MLSFSIDKKSSVCYEPFIAEPKTVVSFTVVSEYEYPAEQCNDAQKVVREQDLKHQILWTANIRRKPVHHVGRPKVCLYVSSNST